ncbi:MAG: TonB-dependent receptor plug domain-containing protein [Bacteroidales bacterium]|nr:TonB-dependent receptor plug domain-containing protein [Bacteroidales bacterium]
MKKRFIILVLLALLAQMQCLAQEIFRDSLGLRSAFSNNPAGLIQGQIPGVRVSSTDGNPVGAMNVNIRGINSIHSENQPLWIVDGVMVPCDLRFNSDAFWQYPQASFTSQLNPLAFLDPNIIESIEVQKDASATSIYGTRGANGVIIVNTRMGDGLVRQAGWGSNVGFSQAPQGEGFSHNHYLTIAGSANGTSYNVSGYYRDTKGVLADNSAMQAGVKLGFLTKANQALWFGFNSILSAGASSSPYGVSWVGTPSFTLSTRDAALSATTPDDWKAGYDDESESYRALTSAFMQINITPMLYFKASAGTDVLYDRRIQFYGAQTIFGAVSAENANGGRASNLVTESLSFNADAELGWNRYFAHNHHFSVKLDAQVLGSLEKFNTMNGYNFALDILRGKSLNVGNYLPRIRKFNRNYVHTGAFGQVSYDFKGLTGVDLSLRADRTPKYGSETVMLLPAVNTYVDIRSLAFPGSRLVSALKLNAGWGVSGYEDYIPYVMFDKYAALSQFVPAPGTLSFHDGVNILKSREWTVSMEAELFDGRVSAGVTYYDRKTDDELLMVQTGNDPYGTGEWKGGYSETVMSSASIIANRGFELSAGLKIISTKEWEWKIAGNVTVNENKILDTSVYDYFNLEIGNGIVIGANQPNLPAGSFIGYAIDASGKPVDQTGEGIITNADMVNLGSPVPVYFGGLQTKLRFRRLTFDALFDGAAGHKVANLNRMKTTDVMNPSFVESADFCRIAQLGVCYDIPFKIFFVKSFSLKASCHNLAVLSGYSGWNPDVNCFSWSPGVDYGSYPLARTFMIGASLRF